MAHVERIDLLLRRSSCRRPSTSRDEQRRDRAASARRGCAVPQAVLDAVEAGEARVVDATGQPVRQAVDRAVGVAERAVGGAEPLVDEVCGQPVAPGRGEVGCARSRRAAATTRPRSPGSACARSPRTLASAGIMSAWLTGKHRSVAPCAGPATVHGRTGDDVVVLHDAPERVRAGAQIRPPWCASFPGRAARRRRTRRPPRVDQQDVARGWCRCCRAGSPAGRRGCSSSRCRTR